MLKNTDLKSLAAIFSNAGRRLLRVMLTLAQIVLTASRAASRALFDHHCHPTRQQEELHESWRPIVLREVTPGVAGPRLFDQLVVNPQRSLMVVKSTDRRARPSATPKGDVYISDSRRPDRQAPKGLPPGRVGQSLRLIGSPIWQHALLIRLLTMRWRAVVVKDLAAALSAGSRVRLTVLSHHKSV